jgi:hypothetical protein
MYLIKVSPTGQMIWQQTYGGTGDDAASEIITTVDGNLLLAGYTSNGSGGKDVFLVKVDTDGNLIWQKNYGGSSDDYAEDLFQDTDGTIWVNGTTASFGAGLRDIYLLKLNATGDSIWTKTYGGSLDDGGASLIRSSSGSIFLLNYTDNFGAVNRDLYLLKINDNGVQLSAGLYGGSGYEEAQSIEEGSYGHLLLFGHTASFGHPEHDMFMALTDTMLSFSSLSEYGGANHDGGEHAIQTSDGGALLIGRSSSYSNGMEQALAIKYDSHSALLWQRDIGGTSNDAAYNVMEAADAYLLVGNTQGPSNGNNDVFLVKIKK